MNDVKITEPWDVGRIREAFIDDGGLSEYHDPINGARTQRLVMGDIFDRWLAARDAKFAAEQPATPTPSTEQIKAEALREAADEFAELSSSTVEQTMPLDDYAYQTTESWLRNRAAALVSPVSEQPTPLDPEPESLTPCGARACTGCRVCGCPSLGIEPQARYEQGGK